MPNVSERIRAGITRAPSVGVVGVSSWDTLLAVDSMPSAGGFSMVSDGLEQAGGTSANIAVTAATLGAKVELISSVGNDEAGQRLLDALRRADIDCSGVSVDPTAPTDQTTVISSKIPPDRTIFWRTGAIPRRGHRIDIDRLFTRDLVILDSVDPLLRRFLIDLPVHTYPMVKILAPMTYVIDFPGPGELESIVRCDSLVGSERELISLVEEDSLENAIEAVRALMRISNLRSAAVTLGNKGALAFDMHHVYRTGPIAVDVVDTTGAGDAFAGAFGFALACRLDLPLALALANCAAGLSVRSLGAQAGLPGLDEVLAQLISYTSPEQQ